MKTVVVILALVLALVHPWLILAAELAALAVIAAGVARAAGVSFRTPWRYP